MNRYLFLKMTQFQKEHIFFILFVDILKTAAVIQDNYDAFRQVIGDDFHPLELVLNMKEKDSILWEKIGDNTHLYGILFGFGKMNSYLFHWQQFDHPESCNDFCKNVKSYFSRECVKDDVKFTINEFQIPGFKSYNSIDPVIDTFQAERNRIKEIYKDKDFLHLTLQKLTE